MFRTQNLCRGSKNVFFVSEQQNLFLQHMFPARLNWETFGSATMFPILARLLVMQALSYYCCRSRLLRNGISIYEL